MMFILRIKGSDRYISYGPMIHYESKEYATRFTNLEDACAIGDEIMVFRNLKLEIEEE